MNGWPTKSLGELCEVEGGNAAPQGDEHFKDGTIPFVRMKDLGRYHLTNSLTETDDKLTENSAAKNRMKLFEPGCILFPRSGSVALNHRAILGARAAIVSHIGVLHNFRPEITVSYLYLYLTTFDMTALSKKTTGVDSIAFADVKRIPIPVPPLEEQQRIVKLLDEADELRKLRTHADRRTAGLIPALFHEMFGEVGSAAGWPLERFGGLVTIEAILVNPREKEFQDLPHIGPDRIEQKTGKLLQSKSAKEDGLISAKFLFDERDVLYSKIRPNLRKAALPEKRGLCSADMYPVRPGTRLVREFLWAYLLTDYFTERAVELSARANMPKLNRPQLESISAPVPPLPLQKEFAQRVAEIRAMEAEQAVSHRRLDDLFNSLLHRAFEGEL